MSVCEDCKKDMRKVDGCNHPYIIIDGEQYERDRECWSDTFGRCGDCGIMSGGFHHFGCDIERCPKCNMQLISCDCDKQEVLKKKRKKNKERFWKTQPTG